MVKMIAFDFFGVLCPPMYGGFLRDVFSGDENKYNEWMKIVVHDLDIGDVSEDAFVGRLAAEVNQDSSELKQRSYEYAILNEELLTFILELKKKYQIGLLTNAPRSLIENVLKEKLALFDTTAISGDVHMIKPDPNFFKYFIEKTGFMANEILFTDDNPANIAAAAGLGMRALLFTTASQFQSDFPNALL